MSIRNFRRDDANEVVSLWNRSLREDKTNNEWYVEGHLLSKEGLEKIVSNANFDFRGAFVACEGQKIIGFARGAVKKVKSYEDEKLEDLPGYLEGLMVAPSARRRGIGTELLQNVQSYIKAEGKDTIEISPRPAIVRVTVLPETPEYKFLLKRGFKPLSCEIKLKLNFEDFTLRDKIIETRERLKQKGIEIRYFEPRDKASFSTLMQANFQGWWRRSYKPNLQREEPLPVLVAVDKDRVVGFVGFVKVGENKRAGFSPGVDPAYRKRGIGKVLVNLWAKEVKEMGAEESLISTGTENFPAQRIYFDMGYEKIGKFWRHFTKNLKG